MVFSSKSVDYYTYGVLFIKNGKFSISSFDDYDLIMPQWWNFIVGIGEIIEENKQKTELRHADMDACLTITKQRGALLIEKKYGKTIISCHLVDEKEFIITFLNAAQLYQEFAEKYFSHTNLGKEKEYVENLLELYKGS